MQEDWRLLSYDDTAALASLIEPADLESIMESVDLEYLIETAGLEFLICVAYLEETYMEHADSKIISLTNSCIYYVVFNFLAYEIKESAKTALRETAYFEEVIGDNIEDGEVAVSG